MSFLETPRLPDCIAVGAVGGPGYSTDVITVQSGFEQRNMNWLNARARYEVGHAARSRENMELLSSFFRAMKGRAHGFRFKDHSDYQATQANGRLGVGVGTGLPTAQLNKLYQAGGLNEYRGIKKPVAGSIKLYRNGVLFSPGAIDTASGIVTFATLSSKAITAISKANPGVVTANAHGFLAGQVVYIAGVAGMTQVNNRAFTVANPAANSFQLQGENTIAYGTYTSGGTGALYPQAGDALTWEGEFDVPVRFDADQMQITMIDKNHYEWQSVQLVEIRV
jgi:uncharacterized protein (TIGR02217 family)